jgi:hypothetical protein
LGRRTYVNHAEAFEPMPAGDPFGDAMNAPAKYVVSKTLSTPIWRNTSFIRDNVVESVRALKEQIRAVWWPCTTRVSVARDALARWCD